jgi:hypothetical protein
MLLIPELGDTVVREAAKHRRGWRAPVSRQDRFPHGEDFHLDGRMLVKDLLDCGGPPQANRSGGRQQQDDPDIIRRAVKVAFQSSERVSRQISEGRLPGRYLMAREIIAYRDCQNDRGNSDKQRGFYSSHRIDLWD